MIRAFLVLVMLSFTYPLQVVESEYSSNIAWSPDGEWIAYTKWTGGNNVFVMDPDGGNVSGVSRCWSAEWMPDGETIACVSHNDSGGDSIRVVNADGSNPVTVFSDASGIESPSWSPDGHQVAYRYADADGRSQIRVADIRDKSVVQLTDGPTANSMPAWSPDGTQIAYLRDDANSIMDQIRLVDADGENDTVLTSKTNMGRPVWSPDSAHIAYNRGTALYVIDRNGTDVTTLDAVVSSQYDWSPASDRIAYGRGNEVWTTPIDGGAAEMFATFSDDILVEWVDWSPDGKAIAAGTHRTEVPYLDEIYVVDSEGAEPAKISHDIRNEGQPLWSPDGSRILFRSTRETNYQVCLTNPYGRQHHCVAAFASISFDGAPAWSPDSRLLTIAATAYDSGRLDVYLIDVDSSVASNLTTSAEGERHPAFSPDGTRIVFVRGSEIWTMDADGGNQTQLTSDEVYKTYPLWSPDGQRIAYQVIGPDPEGPGESQFAVWIMDADGGQQQRLTDDVLNDRGTYQASYDWSPDSEQIVYAGNWTCGSSASASGPTAIDLAPPSRVLCVVDVESGQITELVDEPDSYQPAWSPDGSRIAYVTVEYLDGDPYIENTVWVLELTANESRRIASEGEYPQWSADGTKIAVTVSGDGVWVLEADVGE